METMYGDHVYNSRFIKESAALTVLYVVLRIKYHVGTLFNTSSRIGISAVRLLHAKVIAISKR